MEKHAESALTVKGQATIPKAIREHLGLQPGDRVKFFVHPDGSVVLLPKLPATELRGMIRGGIIRRGRRRVTLAEMDRAAAEGAAGEGAGEQRERTPARCRRYKMGPGGNSGVRRSSRPGGRRGSRRK